jgi:hypothetical protein
MAEAGAPEGFEDIVAAIIPIPGDQPDTPAHWSVTFATEDADSARKQVRVREQGTWRLVGTRQFGVARRRRETRSKPPRRQRGLFTAAAGT